MPEQDGGDFIEKILAKRFRLHDESISLPGCRANAHFCHAVSLWDFSPVRTAAIAKRVLKTLRDALELVKDAAKDNIGIYTSIRSYSEMMTAQDFIRCVERAIRMVATVAGEDLAQRDDGEIIKTEGSLSSMLMTLNF